MADVARKVIAVLIALRALTNLGKPFGEGSGFVVLGRLLHGVASTVVAPLFGLAMLVYAYGLWDRRPWARPLGVAYAAWATVNVVLFPILEGVPPQFSAWMYVLFAVPGIVVPWLAVWLLGRTR
ncbi:MAG TPA: hypothetical protein VEM57_02265 [Candidatus Binatus sp.]|nr:hypothetical protein [Candidatus Binatus sp.]